MKEQQGAWVDSWAGALDALKDTETYLERTEKLLFRRLWEYILAQNWGGVGQVTATLVALHIV